MTYKIKQFKNKNRTIRQEQRFIYDIYFGEDKSPMNFETKEGALKWIERAKKEGFAVMGTKPQILIVPRKSTSYKLGEMWRDDFDYIGMVKTGSKVNSSWTTEKLEKLFDSYEDVNYHTSSENLWLAIQERKKGNDKKAKEYLEKFKKDNEKMLKGWEE